MSFANGVPLDSGPKSPPATTLQLLLPAPAGFVKAPVMRTTLASMCHSTVFPEVSLYQSRSR